MNRFRAAGASCLVVLALPALGKDRECAKKCDEGLRPMAADCRKSEKEPAHEGGGRAEAESCKSRLAMLRTACMKDCTTEKKQSRD